MNNVMIVSLWIVILVLVVVIIYQRISYKQGTQKDLQNISRKLADILQNGSDEKVMVFTGNKELIELMSQINRMLIDRQKIKVDFKRSEISSKKMLSNISHDIKTPLTVILGYLEIMRLNNSQDEMLQRVEEKAKQVMKMINEFFTLAKLEAGDTSIEISRIDISETCRENIVSFYEILSQKDFTVDITIPEKAIYVQGDKDAIQRIILNLVTNAIRYGNDGKYLGVNVYEDSSCAYIEIIDKGKGIEKEFAANVFDRLYTMDDSRNRNIQGNGLGLTIAKNLANQLGGDITLYSEPNTQTVFTVKLKKLKY